METTYDSRINLTSKTGIYKVLDGDPLLLSLSPFPCNRCGINMAYDYSLSDHSWGIHLRGDLWKKISLATLITENMKERLKKGYNVFLKDCPYENLPGHKEHPIKCLMEIHILAPRATAILRHKMEIHQKKSPESLSKYRADRGIILERQIQEITTFQQNPDTTTKPAAATTEIAPIPPRNLPENCRLMFTRRECCMSFDQNHSAQLTHYPEIYNCVMNNKEPNEVLQRAIDALLRLLFEIDGSHFISFGAGNTVSFNQSASSSIAQTLTLDDFNKINAKLLPLNKAFFITLIEQEVVNMENIALIYKELKEIINTQQIMDIVQHKMTSVMLDCTKKAQESMKALIEDISEHPPAKLAYLLTFFFSVLRGKHELARALLAYSPKDTLLGVKYNKDIHKDWFFGMDKYAAEWLYNKLANCQIHGEIRDLLKDMFWPWYSR